MGQYFFKRLLDLAGAGAVMTVLAPVLAGIALIVHKKLGSPIFFCQKRPGLFGKPFTIYKFRTMRDLKDENGKLLPDSNRLTPIGRFLRRTSLDELPELWNVFKGDMSIVGPRPLLLRYVPRYNKQQARRHEAKPGLTGWAQVNGRNAISWDKKFQLDVWYVDHWSILLDLKIILMTVQRVIHREGISHLGEATMPEFKPVTSQPL